MDGVLVFSAHGIPVSLVKKGDPYQAQVEQTCSAIRERVRELWSRPIEARVFYQSKVGTCCNLNRAQCRGRLSAGRLREKPHLWGLSSVHGDVSA
jgi:hypothetical protein